MTTSTQYYRVYSYYIPYNIVHSECRDGVYECYQIYVDKMWSQSGGVRVISFITQKMEVSNYLRKFKLLLDYVFEGKVVLNENTTEKLLKLLEDRSDNSELRTIL